MTYEIDFLPVGDSYGDAIVVRYGDETNGYYLHVVDGGRSETGQTIIDHIDRFYSGYFINHMVLSHADNDHACGLADVLRRFEVKNLWMNRPWLYASEVLQHFHGNYSLAGLVDAMKERHPYLVELEEIANSKGTQIHEAFQGDWIGQFRVLAPSRRRYLDLIPDFEKTPTSYRAEDRASSQFGLMRSLMDKARKWLEEAWDVETLSDNPQPPTSASNESCLVQYAELDSKGILLTADVGPEGLTEAADYAGALQLRMPGFVQMPHHGSRHNVTPAVLDRWLGPRKVSGTVIGTAFCSIGANKPEYPRGQVKNAFIRRGFEVFANRAQWISHYSGGGHPGAVPLTPEAFDSKVEAP